MLRHVLQRAGVLGCTEAGERGSGGRPRGPEVIVKDDGGEPLGDGVDVFTEKVNIDHGIVE